MASNYKRGTNKAVDEATKAGHQMFKRFKPIKRRRTYNIIQFYSNFNIEHRKLQKLRKLAERDYSILKSNQIEYKKSPNLMTKKIYLTSLKAHKYTTKLLVEQSIMLQKWLGNKIETMERLQKDPPIKTTKGMIQNLRYTEEIILNLSSILQRMVTHQENAIIQHHKFLNEKMTRFPKTITEQKKQLRKLEATESIYEEKVRDIIKEVTKINSKTIKLNIIDVMEKYTELIKIHDQYVDLLVNKMYIEKNNKEAQLTIEKEIYAATNTLQTLNQEITYKFWKM